MNAQEQFDIAKEYLKEIKWGFFYYSPDVPKEVIFNNLSKKENEKYTELCKNYLQNK